MSNASISTDLDTFRAEVRRFLEDAVPADIRASVRAHCLVTEEQARRWQAVLHERGWAAPGWPREHGGTGWSLARQAVFREELAASDAPRFENLGIDTIGPTIIRNGTPEQRARFLPRILSFEDYWAQAYSEPDTGSDLASLRTVAHREGEHYVVSGTKIWQSYGHWSNWALVLVRTDPGAAKKQNGISVLLIDLKSPGVTVRPIRFMHGGTLHVEMFFDQVRVPVANLLGQENAGWSIAKGLLIIERLFVARMAECKADLAATYGMLEHALVPVLDEYRRRLAEVDIRARAMEATWWPAVRAVDAGQEPALESSLLKLQGNELLQDMQQLQLDLLGPDALVFDPSAVQGRPSDPPLTPAHAGNFTMHMWRYRGVTLGGGTSEVQRNIIAKAIFSGQTELELPLTRGMTEDQIQLDDGLRRLLAERYDFDARRAILAGPEGGDAGFWQAYGELGLRGLIVPERDGGFGGDLPDLLPVMSALGEALVVEPILWCSALPTLLLLDATGFEGRATTLQTLMDGTRVAFAHEERAAAVTARREGDGWHLQGGKVRVMGGDAAERFLLSARLDGGGLALFDCSADAEGVSVRRYRLHDGRGAADLQLSALRLPASAKVTGPERTGAVIDEALAFATLALCAESVGAMRRALALTVEHLRVRKQFGRSLSDYQALQHRMVEHLRGWIEARGLLHEAATGWAGALPTERGRRIGAAKWMAGRAGRSIALDALQLHGAVGLQDETAISHHARRLLANDMLLGDAGTQLSRFIALGHPTP